MLIQFVEKLPEIGDRRLFHGFCYFWDGKTATPIGGKLPRPARRGGLSDG